MNCKPGSKDNKHFQKEFEQMKSNAAERNCNEPIRLSDFCKSTLFRCVVRITITSEIEVLIYYIIFFYINTVTRQAFRGLIIGSTLMAISQFSGSFALVNFAETIFKDSGSTIQPHIAAIVMAVLQIFGSYMTSTVIDKVGRKMLLVVSAMGTALGLAVMASYMHFQKLNYDLSHLQLLPVVSLSFVLVVSSLGLVSVPYVIIAEVLPRKVSFDIYHYNSL